MGQRETRPGIYSSSKVEQPFTIMQRCSNLSKRLPQDLSAGGKLVQLSTSIQQAISLTGTLHNMEDT